MDSATLPDLVIDARTYGSWLKDLKEQIRSAQLRAGLAVNKELVLLYWNIGREILKQQDHQGWGSKVIARLSVDLRLAFPQMKGFSERNLKYMRAFAAAWDDFQFVQEVLAQLSWYHNITLLDKLTTDDCRVFYAKSTIENGWSRNVMVHQIDSKLYERTGKATHNFPIALPSPQSELAEQILKDPYNFDFLTLGKEYREAELEKSLVNHIKDFLLEMGRGFAFLGSQYKLTVSYQDFYLDMLFYHVNLRCYFVLEPKCDEFKPEYAGKMNFYLSAVDDLLRNEGDNPTIGLILCREKDRIVAEYTLRDITKPLGIAEYKLLEQLPSEFQSNLPSLEELESSIANMDADDDSKSQ